jgi:hypothetical protein
MHRTAFSFAIPSSYTLPQIWLPVRWIDAWNREYTPPDTTPVSFPQKGVFSASLSAFQYVFLLVFS